LALDICSAFESFPDFCGGVIKCGSEAFESKESKFLLDCKTILTRVALYRGSQTFFNHATLCTYLLTLKNRDKKQVRKSHQSLTIILLAKFSDPKKREKTS
jgi:hypothetical protein